MLIDIHVHTNRYSACGRATPEEMVARACAIGLGGLVITEHHIRWGAAELAALQAQFPAIKLFSVIEVSSPELDDYLIYGVSDPDVWAPPIDPARLIPRVRAAGGVVILANPIATAPKRPPSWIAIPWTASK
jgi:predicted metal-dependent phosphoesterase TrpH